MPLTLDWLPPARDFRQALSEVVAEPDPALRLNRLAALAGHRLGFLETLQVDRALAPCFEHTPAGFARVKLAVLGSATIDHLGAAIRVAGLRRRLLIDVFVGGFGQYRQDVLEPSSAFRAFGADIILFSLTSQDALAGAALSATDDDVEAASGERIAELGELWRRARQTGCGTVIQQNFIDTSEPVFGSYDLFVPGSPARRVQRLNERLRAAAREEGVALLDIARASSRHGVEAWFDRARWLQGKYEIAPAAAPLYGEMLVRMIAAGRGLSKKCLVLDLDDTLWGGTVGEEGVEGLVLGEGTARGEAHLALQRYAKQQQERGVILAVCSKNNLDIAEAAFRDHPEMVLKREDIAAFVANWNDKAENLRAIAETLNIGLDSLVFVDDNPAERARIRESLPMVAVPELPDDPAYFVQRLADGGFFEAVSFTPEDRQRSAQYAANQRRDALLHQVQSVDDFLRGLEMTVVHGPFAAVDLARIAQLINKTNQFNPTTRRYQPEQVKELAASPETVTLQFRLLDRFGDNGLVSAMILRPREGGPDAFEIDTWIMSCRVFGRQLEFEAMNIAVEALRGRGVGRLFADYVPTAKNKAVEDVFDRLGFACVETSSAAAGATRWSLDLADYRPHRTWLTRRTA
jgi:FkbH-like protein